MRMSVSRKRETGWSSEEEEEEGRELDISDRSD